MSDQAINAEQTVVELDSAAKARRRFYRVWTWVGAIALTGVGVYLANLLATPIGIIIWTIVIVFILRAPVNWLERHGVGRFAGTAIAYVLLVLVLGALIIIMFSPGVGVGDQFADLANSLPSYVESAIAWASDLYSRYSDVLQNEQVQQWISSTVSALGSWAQTIASESASGVVAAGASIANTIMVIGFALVVAFWVLMDLPRIGREASRFVSPERQDDARMLYLTSTRVMGGYIKATVIQCAIIGVACGILFTFAGVPSPAALGTITGLLNIIPIVGPWLGGALAFVVSVFTSPIVALIALAGTIVIQQAVYTFISPRIMGNSVDIHPALTFIALLSGSAVGTAMGGLTGALVGALLSIPLVAMAKSIFVYYFEKNTGRRIVSEDGVFFRGVASEAELVDPMADATATVPAPPVPVPNVPSPSALLAGVKESREESPEDTQDNEKR